MEAGDYKNLDFLRRKGSSIPHMALLKKNNLKTYIFQGGMIPTNKT